MSDRRSLGGRLRANPEVLRNVRVGEVEILYTNAPPPSITDVPLHQYPEYIAGNFFEAHDWLQGAVDAGKQENFPYNWALSEFWFWARSAKPFSRIAAERLL